MPVLVVGVENAVPVIIFVMDVQDSVIVVILIVNVVPAQTFPQCTVGYYTISLELSTKPREVFAMPIEGP